MSALTTIVQILFPLLVAGVVFVMPVWLLVSGIARLRRKQDGKIRVVIGMARPFALGISPERSEHCGAMSLEGCEGAEGFDPAFEDLPADWRCPRCRQPKDKFNRA